jgi:DNA mismatch repair protein MutS
MQVDKITLQDIGLFDNEESKGLITHLNHCKTNGGIILFEKYLSQPLSNHKEILNRQQALAIYIQQLPFGESMKITNGTTLVIDKFFETSFENIPIQISALGAYWFRFSNKADFSLIKYSVEHLVTFYQNLNEWIALFELQTGNPIIDALVHKVKKILAHPALVNIQSKSALKDPQSILSLAYFFIYQYRNNTRSLLECFYEIDAYYSMATAVKKYHFEFPTWVESSTPYFEVEAAIHPLIKDPVHNSITLSRESNLLFLTGANMAGKSTFIKTIGIVLYLAHIGMGAPAKKIKLSLLDGLVTNLTIADNVVKGESYFFNEVQRIKNTIEKISDGKKYFVLIDELFKGTNIQDAMKCSIKVISGLQKLRTSLFIISTHLYEISDELKPYSNIQFSYFETEIKGKELLFHYQLKTGISEDRIGYLLLERQGVVAMLDKLA